ncbi:MAG: hypothetical protein ACLU84_03230 [Clostridia bacterium]
MKEKAKQKGVTLIALVITIIILIILAGVAINALIGENGLITQAKQAKSETLNAQVDSDAKLKDLAEEIDKQVEGNGGKNTTVEEIKNNGTFAIGNMEVKDNKGNKVVIPDGFKIAEDSGINVSEGIVIEDNDLSIDGNGNSRGNQFVWVPVSNLNQDGNNPIIKADGTEIEITLGRYTFETDGTESLVQNAEKYLDETLIPSHYKELTIARISNNSSGLDATNTTAKNLKGFIDSVRLNGGYYIARYEASYRDGKKPYSKVSVTATTSSTQTDGKLWNNITQLKAAEAAKAMYSNSHFEADLMNSYAWDTAISYIQKCSGDTDYSRKNSVNTSIANTGKTGDEVCKIHDMASNLYEWTTEYSTNKDTSKADPCVNRGGYYFNSTFYTSIRGYHSVTGSYSYSSFRPILYM